MTGHSESGISVVVPVYNSASTLPALIGRLVVTLSMRDDPFEIIVVDDGSDDGSGSIARHLAGREPRLRVLRLRRNYGQHNALLAGVRVAGYSVVVTLDDDLQNPPEEIFKLVDALTEGVDVVYGVPTRREHNLWRRCSSWLIKVALSRALPARVARMVGPYRAFRTDLRDGFDTYRSPFVSLDVLLSWCTSRFAGVPVRHDERLVGKSTYSFRRLTRLALTMLTGFSATPLRLAGYMGFAFTFFGVVVFGYVVIHYLVAGGSVPGFTFLAAIISLFSGAQLFSLGIIGEYLARMHFRLLDRAPYLVADDTWLAAPAQVDHARLLQPATAPRSPSASVIGPGR